METRQMTRSFSIKTILLADAATCAAMGALLVLATDRLAGLTGIPAQLLLYAGWSLLPIAVFMAAAARLAAGFPAAPWLAVAGNALWVAASIGLLLGPIAPNALGISFILAQAAAVAFLAWLEYRALQPGSAAIARAG
jgi:hypothetical protein